jgi:Cu-processing system permease protein
VRVALHVAMDILREAASRKWFLALGIAITAVLVFLAFALRMDVVDGALAATRFFGSSMHTDIQSADVAMRPVFKAVAWVVFYGGLLFGILSCADFGPSLLSPGRIEHLLSLPVRRWELLLGTFLGVVALGTLGSLYGAGGVALLLGVKTGVWTARPIAAALIASVAFAGIYGPMLTSALFARSPALSAATGVVLYILGIVAGYRVELADLFGEGAARAIFQAVTVPLPHLKQLADLAVDIAGSAKIDAASLGRSLLGVLLFGFASLMVGMWRFEKKDF